MKRYEDSYHTAHREQYMISILWSKNSNRSDQDFWTKPNNNHTFHLNLVAITENQHTIYLE